MPADADALFTGSIPELYDTYLVPMIFEPYAADLVARLQSLQPATLLEVAAGTGAVTRAMAAGLPNTAIVATDLNQAMLDHAARVGISRPVTWMQADALGLPQPDGSVDAVVCQFGVMFFPDRPRAFAEMRRVLRPGGTLLFNVWTGLEHNEFAAVATAAASALYPDAPLTFVARTPHGYHDPEQIRADLAAGGFTATPRIDVVDAVSRAATSEIPAIGYCQGTPMRAEIEARDASRLAEATEVAAAALGDRFGTTDLEGNIRALVVTVTQD